MSDDHVMRDVLKMIETLQRDKAERPYTLEDIERAKHGPKGTIRGKLKMPSINDWESHQWNEETQSCSCGFKDAVHRMSHLHIEQPLFEGRPSLWIQWKGTDVCCDIYCDCGAQLHYDGDFLYFFKCPKCGEVWETGTSVAIYKVKDNRADGALVQEIEDA